MALILSGTDGLSDVDGSAATPAIRGTDANTGIFFPAADTIAFSEGGVESMRIDSSGNVGIGTSAPATQLQIGSASGTGKALRLQATGTTEHSVEFASDASVYGKIGGGKSGSGIGDLRFYTYSGGSLPERMRIDSSGNLLVGRTGFGGSATGSELGANGFFGSYSPNTTNSNTTFAAYSNGASAYRFYVGWGGTVFATSTTISAISDQRLKENVQDLDVGLDAVMVLKPRKFDWKEGKGKDIKGDRGWIAQEFEQVFPDMVDEWLDPSPEGEEPYKSVRADLIPVLVKAIQELKALVDTQASTITALQADVEALKAQ